MRRSGISNVGGRCWSHNLAHRRSSSLVYATAAMGGPLASFIISLDGQSDSFLATPLFDISAFPDMTCKAVATKLCRWEKGSSIREGTGPHTIAAQWKIFELILSHSHQLDSGDWTHGSSPVVAYCTLERCESKGD